MANVRGALEVEMVCDVCDKAEWLAVAVDDCETCVEYEVTKHSDWAMADDALVCGEECERRFWDDEIA